MIYLYLSLCSSIDEASKEKLAPFSTLSGDESYQSRDLEKVYLRTLSKIPNKAILVIHFLFFKTFFSPLLIISSTFQIFLNRTVVLVGDWCHD